MSMADTSSRVLWLIVGAHMLAEQSFFAFTGPKCVGFVSPMLEVANARVRSFELVPAFASKVFGGFTLRLNCRIKSRPIRMPWLEQSGKRIPDKRVVR